MIALPSNGHIATPYAGIRYSDATRRSYAEAATAAVTTPISYDNYFERLTTAMVGVRFTGLVTQAISYRVGLGSEYDVANNPTACSGSSAIRVLNPSRWRTTQERAVLAPVARQD